MTMDSDWSFPSGGVTLIDVYQRVDQFDLRQSTVRKAIGKRGVCGALTNTSTRCYPRHLWNQPDLVARFLEYVRTHFHEIVPGVSSRCQVHLFAGRTAHNGSQVLPLLGLSAQSGLGEDGPGPTELIGAVEAWMSGLTEDEMRALAEATPGPSWEELLRRREGCEP